MSIRIVSTLVIFLTCINGPAFAAGAGVGSLMSLEMLFKGINFIILLLLLYRFARKPIAGMLAKVAVSSKETMDTAKKRLEAAQNQLKDYQEKLANLEKELEARQKTALEAIKTEQQKIIDDAEIQAKKLEEQSKDRIEQDLSKAKAAIREFIANESVKLAESIIENEIDAKAQKTLIDTYTDSLKETV